MREGAHPVDRVRPIALSADGQAADDQAADGQATGGQTTDGQATTLSFVGQPYSPALSKRFPMSVGFSLMQPSER